MAAESMSIGAFARVVTHELRDHAAAIAGGAAGDLARTEVDSLVGHGFVTTAPFQSARAVGQTLAKLAKDPTQPAATRAALGGATDALAGARTALNPLVGANQGQAPSADDVARAVTALRAAADQIDTLQRHPIAAGRMTIDADKLPGLQTRLTQAARSPRQASPPPTASYRPPAGGARTTPPTTKLSPDLEARLAQLQRDTDAQLAQRRAAQAAAEQQLAEAREAARAATQQPATQRPTHPTPPTPTTTGASTAMADRLAETKRNLLRFGHGLLDRLE